MACNTPYYLRPYFWLIFLTMILFLIFIVIIETNKSFTSTGYVSAGMWVLFFFIILFLITSFIWYYYDSLNSCDLQIPLPQYVQSENALLDVGFNNVQISQEPECTLDMYYDDPEKISYIEDDYIPLTSLNPFI